MSERKNFILCTDVILHDPSCFTKFKGNNVYIPDFVIKELETIRENNVRKMSDISVFQAKEAFSKLKPYLNGNLQKTISNDGMKLEDDINLRIVKTDNKDVLSLAQNYNKETGNKFIIISKKESIRIDAAFKEIEAEDYKYDRVLEEQITSTKDIILNENKYAGLFYPEDDILSEYASNLFPNMFVRFHNTVINPETAILKRFKGNKFVNLSEEYREFCSIKHRNVEQQIAFELLSDKSVECVTIAGGAGSGKTIVSIAAGIQQTIIEPKYDKIIYVRPTDVAQGALPGDLYDKLKPWMMPFFDSLRVILTKSELALNKSLYKEAFDYDEKSKLIIEEVVKKLIDNEKLELQTFDYMRGRTFHNCFIIIDEAQQFTPHIAKLLLTRSGEGSKFVMIGDPSDNQIDNSTVDPRSNGLVYIAAKMRPTEASGHITFSKIERSKLAAIADELLQ